MHSAYAASMRLVNCTFIGNTSTGEGGGAIYGRQSSIDLIDCIFTGNSATGASARGGAIMVNGGQPTALVRLTRCTFEGNTANRSGGAITAAGAAASLADCIFRGNTARFYMGYGGAGGAVEIQNSTLSVTGCLFSGNAAIDGIGGAISSDGGSASFAHCTFSDNTSGEGGAISNRRAALTLVRCDFTANTAGNGGAMSSYSQSSQTLINCVIERNRATASGAGMCNFDGSSSTLVNCVLAANVAGGNGGALYNYFCASVTLTNCTVAGNVAKYGGVMYNTYTACSITNSILWGNSASALTVSGTAPTITYSDVQGGHAGPGNINADPRFIRSPGPGADGVLGTADDDAGDLRLGAASPCIDAGSNAAVPADAADLDADGNAAETAPLDLDGQARHADITGTADTGLGTPPIVDMGSFELPSAAGAQVLVVGSSAGDTLLRAGGDEQYLQVWSGVSACGVARLTCPLADLSLRTPASPAGTRLRLDFSGGSPVPAGGLLMSADDELIISASEATLATIRPLLASGRITSALASPTRGLSTMIGADGSIRVRVAIHGDLDWNGTLDADDYFRMDLAFLAEDAGTPQADIDCDGQINGGDYLLMDRAYITQFSAVRVPAPAPSPRTGETAWEENSHAALQDLFASPAEPY